MATPLRTTMSVLRPCGPGDIAISPTLAASVAPVKSVRITTLPLAGAVVALTVVVVGAAVVIVVVGVGRDEVLGCVFGGVFGGVVEGVVGVVVVVARLVDAGDDPATTTEAGSSTAVVDVVALETDDDPSAPLATVVPVTGADATTAGADPGRATGPLDTTAGSVGAPAGGTVVDRNAQGELTGSAPDPTTGPSAGVVATAPGAPTGEAASAAITSAASAAAGAADPKLGCGPRPPTTSIVPASVAPARITVGPACCQVHHRGRATMRPDANHARRHERPRVRLFTGCSAARHPEVIDTLRARTHAAVTATATSAATNTAAAPVVDQSSNATVASQVAGAASATTAVRRSHRRDVTGSSRAAGGATVSAAAAACSTSRPIAAGTTHGVVVSSTAVSQFTASTTVVSSTT